VLLASTTRQRPLHPKGPDARMRTVTTNKDTGVSTTSVTEVAWKTSAYASRWLGTQITESEEHPGWRRSGGRQDMGGNFRTRKRYCETELKSHYIASRDSGTGSVEQIRKYTGPYPAVSASTVTLPPYSQTNTSVLESLGTTAIARCKPTNAVADLSVALGEVVKDGLPSVPRWSQIKEDTDRARRAGSEYLNFEFGWRPLASELDDFGRAVTHAAALMRQYERDAGKIVRRKYSFPPERTKTTVDLGVTTPPMSVVSSAFYKVGKVPEGHLMRERETFKQQWFSGAFSYSLPRGWKSSNALLEHAAKASFLYGVELTPSTVWNLAPWSWAADWVANIGDVLSNVSDFAVDGLVVRYGYIMEHSLIRDTYTYVGETNLVHPTVPQAVSFVTETKIRRKASPFGFGITWDGFSPRQIAILSALGITRGKAT